MDGETAASPAPAPTTTPAHAPSSSDAHETTIDINEQTAATNPSPSPPPEECFLCCEGVEKGVLVTDVCKCRNISMHLKCQRRMLESSYMRSGHVLRCGVCNARYTNAEARPVWRLSLTGGLWCTCPAGVAIMLWSASTVLDRGAINDPKLEYADASWWGYQFHHLTWWRLIGLIYLGIAAFMALVALCWLLIDVCSQRPFLRSIGFHLPEPLCVRRQLVHTWQPNPKAEDGGRMAGAGEYGCRQVGALLLPCTDLGGTLPPHDNEGATVLL